MAETIQIRPGILEWREIEGEIVVVDTRSATYLAVSHSGAKLWPALLAGAQQEELVATLTAEFDLDAATATRDVVAFLETLGEQDLLVR